MATTSLNLALIILVGIGYLFSFAQVISYRLNKMVTPKNSAMLVLFFSAIIAAGINLYNVSEAASNAFIFFMDRKDIVKGILYFLGFNLGMWLFSLLFYLVSFFIVGILTPGDEKLELKRGNMELAGMHGIILVIAPALTALATQFIPYPELPF
jgi:hypothetical protein